MPEDSYKDAKQKLFRCISAYIMDFSTLVSNIPHRMYVYYNEEQPTIHVCLEMDNLLFVPDPIIPIMLAAVKRVGGKFTVSSYDGETLQLELFKITFPARDYPDLGVSAINHVLWALKRRHNKVEFRKMPEMPEGFNDADLF